MTTNIMRKINYIWSRHVIGIPLDNDVESTMIHRQVVFLDMLLDSIFEQVRNDYR